MALHLAILESKVTCTKMEANTLSGSSQVGDCADKARKRMRKPSNKRECDIAVELQPLMQSASLVQPIWQHCGAAVQLSGFSSRSSPFYTIALSRLGANIILATFWVLAFS